jgi:hypothetical protein
MVTLSVACTSPGYNDNPSQQMTKATVGCLVANDFYAVYFSAYIKPVDDAKGIDGDRRALFRSYCKDIPKAGNAFFTADLVGDELRQTPIAVKIVEQELTGGDDKKAENFKDIKVLADIPATVYPKGVVESRADLTKEGYYAIYLTIGEEAISDEDRLRIPLHVGVDPDAKPLWHRIGMIVASIATFLLIAFFSYFFFMRKRRPEE